MLSQKKLGEAIGIIEELQQSPRIVQEEADRLVTAKHNLMIIYKSV